MNEIDEEWLADSLPDDEIVVAKEKEIARIFESDEMDDEATDLANEDEKWDDLGLDTFLSDSGRQQ